MDKYSENNEFEICPYNKSHRVQAGTRFQRHLIECSRDYPDVEEVICKFNFQHRVKLPEYQYHLMHCPDAHFVKNQIAYVAKPGFVPPVLPVSITTEPGNEIDQMENWDNELLPQPMQIPDLSKNLKLHFLNADNLSGFKPAQKRQIRKTFSMSVEDAINHPVILPEVREPPKPTKKPAERTVLKKLPLPKTESQVSQLLLNNAGRGRAIGNALPSNRIAANIFGGPSSSPTPSFLEPVHLNPLATAGFGRGAPAFRSAENQLPPPIRLPQSYEASLMSPSPSSLDEMMIERFNDMTFLGLGTGLTEETESSFERGFGRSLRYDRGMGLSCGSSSSQVIGIPKRLPPGLVPQEEEEKRQQSAAVIDILKLETDSSELSLSNDDMSETCRRKRRLEKKLRQIEKLETRLENGDVLNMEELTKVSSKKVIQLQIESDRKALEEYGNVED